MDSCNSLLNGWSLPFLQTLMGSPVSCHDFVCLIVLRCPCYPCLSFSTSCADFETRLWPVFPSASVFAQSRCVSVDKGSDCSGTPFQALPIDLSYRWCEATCQRMPRDCHISLPRTCCLNEEIKRSTITTFVIHLS